MNNNTFEDFTKLLNSYILTKTKLDEYEFHMKKIKHKIYLQELSLLKIYYKVDSEKTENVKNLLKNNNINISKIEKKYKHLLS